MTHYMPKVRIAAFALALATAGVGAPVLGHHSFAMFDMNSEVQLKGLMVEQFKWANPHVFVIATDGKTRYVVETASPNQLGRSGWKFNTLKVGDKVDLVINPLRNGKPGGALVSATLPDGRKLGG